MCVRRGVHNVNITCTGITYEARPAHIKSTVDWVTKFPPGELVASTLGMLQRSATATLRFNFINLSDAGFYVYLGKKEAPS